MRLKCFVFLFVVGIVFQSCESNGITNQDLEDMVETINNKCPQMIDSETRLAGVELRFPDTLIYKYVLVNALKQNLDTHEFYRNMWPGIFSYIRVSPEIKRLREKKIFFVYSYTDKSNQLIYNFKVGSDVYNH